MKCKTQIIFAFDYNGAFLTFIRFTYKSELQIRNKFVYIDFDSFQAKQKDFARAKLHKITFVEI